MVYVAGALAVSSIASSVYSTNKASNAQKDAASNATGEQMQMFNKVQNNLSPYMNAGTAVLPQLQNQATTGFNFNPTMAQLSQTPGYKFNLQQGLNAVQNSAAARGLGVSGNALRGAADYASGLASNTYQQQFGNALSQYQTNFSNLQNVAGLGENAAAGVGNAAIQTGANIGNNITGAGNAQGAAYLSQGNAVGSAGNNAYGNYLLSNYYGNQGSTFSGTKATDASNASNYDSSLPWLQ